MIFEYLKTRSCAFNNYYIINGKSIGIIKLLKVGVINNDENIIFFFF